MTTLEQIDALIELLTPEGAWCQNNYARSETGMSLVEDSDACMWCLVGGISKVSGVHVRSPSLNQTPLFKAIDNHLLSSTDNSLINWNDAEDRTQSQVLEMLHEVKGKVFKSEVDQVWSES